MSKIKYLIRLDDACPTMGKAKWDRVEQILDQYGVRPMVGIVPDCRDETLMLDPPDPAFWTKAQAWEKKGWAIALHGYNHVYSSEGGLDGLNPLWARSEFAGIPLDIQREKIRKGVAILREHDLHLRFFFAPSHTYDENTLTALREESDIRIISDTIATKPYRYQDFTILPQLGGRCVERRLPGVWTFCLHPNMMSEEDFRRTDSFIQSHQQQFCGFDDLDLERVGPRSLVDRLLSWSYFAYRRIRGIR